MLQYTKIRNVKDPHVGSVGSAGIDFFIPLDCEAPIVCLPNEIVKIPLGIKVILPKNYVMLMQDKSGVANKLGLHSVAGVIDSDYRGEVHACFLNATDKPVLLHCGDKIVQGVIVKYVNDVKQLNNEEYENESKNWGVSSRGTKGFGLGTNSTYAVSDRGADSSL